MKAISKRNSIFLAVLTAMPSFTLNSCKQRIDSGARRSSMKDAVVSSDQVTAAWQLAKKTTEYLPFSYSPDGCWARATYMQMTLAANGVPSDVQFVRVPKTIAEGFKLGQKTLIAGVDGTTWGWHVAPVITTSEGQHLVLDPGLYPNGPVINKKWASDLVPKDNTGNQPYKPIMFKAGNSQSGPDGGQTTDGVIIRSVNEMPTLDQENLYYSYGKMDEYLLRAHSAGKMSDAELATKRATLKNETLRLAENTMARGGISQNGIPNDRIESMPFTENDIVKLQAYNDDFIARIKAAGGNPWDLYFDPSKVNANGNSQENNGSSGQQTNGPTAPQSPGQTTQDQKSQDVKNWFNNLGY